MELINPELLEYIESHTTPESPLLYHIRRQTHLKVLQPRMLSGLLQGQLLSMISCMIQPTRILELGTFTGYSALCMLGGLKPGGQIITIEKNDEMGELIEANFAKSEHPECLKLMIGEALPILADMTEKFDLIFIDADKKEYPQYLNAIKPLLNPGGYIIADNVLWDGKVIDSKDADDKSTHALMEFNRMVQNDPDFVNVLLPIRDGLMLIRYANAKG
ncbi:MAG: O-methyltransferase [Salinivirgaceae bacterium]|nr:O-methyltransferase [Salinivirgaceae bacterium]MDD4747883.1 O-methyltransferase [Salinivirgaceae bacterium]